jgi:hypothetical protein
MKHVNQFLVLLKLIVNIINIINFIRMNNNINDNLVLFLLHLFMLIYNHFHRVQHPRTLSILIMVQHLQHQQTIIQQNHYHHHQLIHFIHNYHLLIILHRFLHHLHHQSYPATILLIINSRFGFRDMTQYQQEKEIYIYKTNSTKQYCDDDEETRMNDNY